MEVLFEQFYRKMAATKLDYIRSLEPKMDWNARLIAIRGARGTGKTTMLLQHIKRTFAGNYQKVLYVSLDNLWFTEHSLVSLADTFYKQGGTHLFLDEVHKYPDWSQAIKNLYDDYPELSIIFTGSSLLEILNARADLSRRALVYTLPGLSFREYLNLTNGTDFTILSLEEILEHHLQLSSDIVAQIRPFAHFSEYLKTGYYPYFLEGKDTYYLRLEETVSLILEVELPLLRNVEIAYVSKLKQLLNAISESAPFIPNVSKLAERIGINRQTLLAYLHYLSDAKLIKTLYRDAKGISILQKPDKLFLENTNLSFLFKGSLTNEGSFRETFFVNQLSQKHLVEFAEQGDFLIDRTYTIEVGGKNKTRTQIKDIPNSYIAADNIEYGSANRIPLWLFGFLY